MFEYCPKCGGKLLELKPTVYLVGTVPIKWNCTWGTCSKCYYVFGIFDTCVRSIDRRLMTVEQYHERGAYA